MGGRDDRIIGVLGGMGPLAGAWFMQRLVDLTPAERDADHVPAILVNDPRVPDRVAPITGEGASPVPAMLEGIGRLAGAGAGIVAIACNTAHRWHGEVADASPVPVLDMIAATADALAPRPTPGPVGLLATRGMIAAGLYQSALAARGLAVVVADDDLNESAVLPAIAAVKAGRMTEAESAARKAVQGMKEQGAQTLFVACTELSVCWPQDLRATTIDSCDELARAVLRWAGVSPR